MYVRCVKGIEEYEKVDQGMSECQVESERFRCGDCYIRSGQTKNLIIQVRLGSASQCNGSSQKEEGAERQTKSLTV